MHKHAPFKRLLALSTMGEHGKTQEVCTKIVSCGLAATPRKSACFLIAYATGDIS
jgi:hypothetical protein